MKITSYEVDKLNDPTGIITGDRYEFLLGIEVPEDDELYEDEYSLDLRVILAVSETEERVLQYHIFNRTSGKVFTTLL